MTKAEKFNQVFNKIQDLLTKEGLQTTGSELKITSNKDPLGPSQRGEIRIYVDLN